MYNADVEALGTMLMLRLYVQCCCRGFRYNVDVKALGTMLM